MDRPETLRYEQLAILTGRVTRAAAELEAARQSADLLPSEQAEELETLFDQARALQALLANDLERAWNAAEAAARRFRRAELIGRVHDAISAETTLPPEARLDLWRDLGPDGPEGRRSDHLEPDRPSGH